MGTRETAIYYLIALMAATMVWAAPASANNIILNGSFESPAVNPEWHCGPFADCAGYHNAVPGNDYIGAWLLLPNAPTENGYAAVMLTGPTYHETNDYTGAQLNFTPEDGNQALDLTGEGNQGTWNGVKQTVATIPGQQYDLTFYLGHQWGYAPGYETYPAALTLWMNGVEVGLFTNGVNERENDITWMFESYRFTADSEWTTIAFQNATDSHNQYAGLDNVSLTEVPEPASLVLLGCGIGALIGMSKLLPSSQQKA
jgi:hypothetical protein